MRFNTTVGSVSCEKRWLDEVWKADYHLKRLTCTIWHHLIHNLWMLGTLHGLFILQRGGGENRSKCVGNRCRLHSSHLYWDVGFQSGVTFVTILDGHLGLYLFTENSYGWLFCGSGIHVRSIFLFILGLVMFIFAECVIHRTLGKRLNSPASCFWSFIFFHQSTSECCGSTKQSQAQQSVNHTSSPMGDGPDDVIISHQSRRER